MTPLGRYMARAALATAGALAMLAPAAQACSVPVFRWALERWPADDYVVVAPKAETSAHIERRLKELGARANLAFRVEDVPDAGPSFDLLYPEGVHLEKPLWSAPLAELDSDALVDSPARRELARRILAGHSAVWLFVPSGDAAKDDAAAALLAQRIADANQTLRLPDMADDPVLEGPDAPDVSGLRVEFSMLTVRRDDPAEAVLARMLLGSEPDLADYAEPLAFPVFGRGRVLHALVGGGINADTIMKACAFIVGRCACEIKAENPGVDLLMAVDWERGIGDNALVGAVEPPPLAGTMLPAGAGPGPVSGGLLRNAGLAAGAAALLVAAASMTLLRRRWRGKERQL